MKLVLSISFLFFILSCSSHSSKTKDPSKFEYGKVPENYEKIFMDSVKAKLKDPGSAKFQKILRPTKTWYNFEEGKLIRHGWAICGEVKEKDSSLYEPHLVFFLDGKAQYIDMIEDAPKDVKFGQYDIFMLLTSGDWPPALFKTKDGKALCPGLESFKKP